MNLIVFGPRMLDTTIAQLQAERAKIAARLTSETAEIVQE